MRLLFVIFLIIAILYFAAVNAANTTSVSTTTKIPSTTAKTTTKITTTSTTKTATTTPRIQVTTRPTTEYTTEETTEGVTDTTESTSTPTETETTEPTPTRTLRPRNTTANTTIPTTTATTVTIAKAQASADASMDNPAYFLVTPVKGDVTLTTNEGTDWVVEYVIIGSTVKKVNEKGTIGTEEVDITSDGTPIYVKITPYLSGITKNVILYGEGVSSITAKSETPGPFKVDGASTTDTSGVGATKAPETTKSPTSLIIVLLSLGVAGHLVIYKRR